ncbi:MAG: polyribonucleotide nucleotidyltransferase [Leptospirales bacterium]
MEQTEKIQIGNTDYVIETGKWAKQAGGSVLIRWGKLVVMANATVAPTAREGADFFPMTVDYREKFYSTGKIPGGFFKREARPSEKEVLTARMTDRPLRPLFPKNFRHELQIFVTLLSADGVSPTQAHAITAASAALYLSESPFDGPVGGVHVGRVDGEFVLFPNNAQLEKSDISLILAGTRDAVTMIEGSAKEVAEEDMLAGIEFGHEHIKTICDAQIALKAKAGKETMEYLLPEDLTELKAEIHKVAYEKLKAANSVKGKMERYEAIDNAIDECKEILEKEWATKFENEEELASELKKVKSILREIEVEIVRDQIFSQGLRADGRKLDEIRDISIDVGVLPATHGSSLFTRGETQSLGVITLGTSNAAQIIDDIEGDRKQNFYLHYNFLPYSVGEVRRYPGPGRREIGHGKLAENALRPVIPSTEDFPYVIRIVSEILESNGSSSMATICSGSLGMMDAGVPIKAPVAGIAMGLITYEDKFAVLSDIAGLEDHFGDMDFKVAGTKNGITAFQLDLKVNGVSSEIMEKALSQAKEGRMHILGKMNEVIDSAREDLAETAPKLESLQIDKDRIGELIGPGGKNIKMLTEKTGAEILIDDAGMVTIASNDINAVNKAKEMIEKQFEEAVIGDIYEGPVKRITDFGAFIEILPGKDGLCHISKLAATRVEKVEDVLKEGEVVKVRVIGVDRMGKISLSIKDL